MVCHGENKKPLGYDVKSNSKGCKTHVKPFNIWFYLNSNYSDGSF